MWQRLRCIVRKEFTQALRDPRMRSMLFLPPLIQLLIFGYAASLDVDNAKIAWMDQDRTPESRELLSEFQGSGRFVIAGMPDSDAAMQRMMDRGQVDAVIVPAGKIAQLNDNRRNFRDSVFNDEENACR